MKVVIGVKETITNSIAVTCAAILYSISVNGTRPIAYPAKAERGLKYPDVML